MRRLPWLCLALLGCSGAAAPGTPAPAASARGSFPIIDSTGATIGAVTLSEDSTAVIVTVQADHLPPGLHGVHLHTVPACDPPLFQSATGHWNPAGRQHGHQNPLGAHLGDLGNLTATAMGEARGQFRIPGASLGNPDPSLGVPGTSLVIHATADDDRTDPSGNSGARIACAAILMSPR